MASCKIINRPTHLFTKAAEQGHADAQNNLGDRYKYGEGILQDYKQAVHWFTKAAEQGHADAQHNLGWMYEDGIGALQDYKQLFIGTRKQLSKVLHRRSLVLVGAISLEKAFQKIIKKAYMWANLAIHNELPKAQKNDDTIRNFNEKMLKIFRESRDTMAKGLSSQDLIEAQEMAKRCLNSGYKNC